MNQNKESLGLPESLSQQVLSVNSLRRKIHSSFALKPPKISPIRCKSALNDKNSTSRLRFKYSKSPFRSKSLKSLQTDKENLRKSPLRADSKVKINKASKSYFKSEKNIKTGLSEFCSNLLKEHKGPLVKLSDNPKTFKAKPPIKVKKTKNSKNSKLASKGKNESKAKKIVIDDKSASGEAKELKIKSKTHLIRKKPIKSVDLNILHLKKQFKSIDLNNLDSKKVKTSSKKKKEEKKTHRSKKTTMKTFDVTSNGFDLLSNAEIFKTADRFEKKKKPLLKRLKIVNTERPASTLPTTKRKTPKKLKIKKTKRQPLAKPEDLNPVINRLKLRKTPTSLSKDQAASKIQGWFRNLIKKRKETPTACPDFDESLIIKSSHRRNLTSLLRPGQFRDLFQKPEEMKLAEKSSNNVTLLSSSSFQLKRPKDLDIENINTPLVTCTFESSPSGSEEKVNQPPVEEAKHSFQSDSLEKPVFKSSSKDIQDFLQACGCYTLEDANQSDLDISSSLMRQFEELTSESKQNSITSDPEYKIPITTPEVSINLTEIVSEIIENEVKLFESRIQFINNELCVDPSSDYLLKFLKVLFSEFKKTEAEVLDIVNTPAFIDPLEKLQLLQSSNIGELTKFRVLDEMIPQEICEFVQKKMDCDKFWLRKFYIQMLFDCVNETFNYLRPFGLKGVPDPWIPHSRLLFGEGELSRVLKKSEEKMKSWVELKGGAFQKHFHRKDQDKLQTVREESMSQLLCFDVNAEEPEWLDYEDEQAQSTNDLGDLVLLDLFKELLDLLDDI
jgi:hypothetical protein